MPNFHLAMGPPSDFSGLKPLVDVVDAITRILRQATKKTRHCLFEQCQNSF